jgi:4-hydroxy-2-oxoheptanedioate aldolase
MIDRLTSHISSGKIAYACWNGFRDPHYAETLAGSGFDVVVLDGQHAFHEESSMLDCIAPVIRGGAMPIVRVPVGRWDMVQKVLDYGAAGTIAPMINTKEDAQAFVSSAKYPGLGERSYGPRYAAAQYGLTTNEYITQANQQTLALAQVETRESYENLDDILSVEGLDGILMGPADFSIFMTGEIIPDPYGKDTIDAVADIAKRTLAAGKIAAAFTMFPEHARLVQDMGYQLISLGMDANIIEAGSKVLLSVKD